MELERLKQVIVLSTLDQAFPGMVKKDISDEEVKEALSELDKLSKDEVSQIITQISEGLLPG